MVGEAKVDKRRVVIALYSWFKSNHSPRFCFIRLTGPMDIEEYAEDINRLSGPRYEARMDKGEVMILAEGCFLTALNEREAGVVAILMHNAVSEHERQFT